jgi:signal peptidase I
MSEAKPKEPLLAVLLSFVLTGLGQIYAGRTKRGVVLLSASLLIPIPVVMYYVRPSTRITSAHLLLLIPLAIGFALFVLIDAYFCTKAWNTQQNLQRKITTGKRILFMIGILFLTFVFSPVELVAMGVAQYVRGNIAQPFKIPSSEAMAPTLVKGDRVLVDKAIYRRSEPQRGDIIVFKYPDDPKRPFIKRLVGLPGETVEIRDGRLVINGSVLQASAGRWATFSYHNQGKYAEKGQPATVPADQYFVLGDNSAASHDSRFWGFVPKQNLIGKAYKIFWPPDRSGALE